MHSSRLSAVQLAIHIFKHATQWNLREFENQFTEFQKRAGIDPGLKSAVDIACKAAEYVEETISITSLV